MPTVMTRDPVALRALAEKIALSSSLKVVRLPDPYRMSPFWEYVGLPSVRTKTMS